ncbi:type II toxin-antitoxin system VapC family toxin [Mesorhizobium sp. LHD-90]|uniref:type II toxin-antitoxin system VapC family toxin n=1 Tax=Mesorhizobium sp. LHD-90 TaxID=3071414 RepID=UPI0027DEBA05|nr:type II toxin-antitoxin system VapC family toxin [Mesorhizobium sp. LHD-90]MDQ6434542.1 type II toxin-antitoxin system VapC family toxin [Mesorhizobium sp. LHD-90]
MTLVDTNVLLDLLTMDPVWVEWSVSALGQAEADGPLVINDVVYAELSSRFERMESVDAFISESRLELLPMPRATLFLAGKAFARYRTLGGTRSGVLPDFFIGAHAVVLGTPILTRDPRRYRTYFPTVSLISPPTA